MIDIDKEAKKAAIKDLRAQRKNLISAASLTMKIQKKDIQAIKDFLKDRAATIPDIAKAINLPKDKTLWYVATLKKYGQIVEARKEGSFFNYALNESEIPRKKGEV